MTTIREIPLAGNFKFRYAIGVSNRTEKRGTVDYHFEFIESENQRSGQVA